jgi:hypothetical protein
MTIDGGTILASGTSRLRTYDLYATTLHNVTLGDASNDQVLGLNGDRWNFSGDTDFRAGTLATLSGSTWVSYLSSRTLAGDFMITSGRLVADPAGETLTIDSGRSISGGIGTLGGRGNFINNGTIQANTNGSTLNIFNTGSFTNNGTILAQSSNNAQSNVQIGYSTDLTNYVAGTLANGIFANGTLTNGTYRALNRGTIIAGTREFRHLAGNATVELGANSVFAAVEGKLTTIGSNAAFIVSGGKNYNVTNAANSFTNNGTVRATGVSSTSVGSNLTIASGVNFTNFSAGTLSGGTYEAVGGGSVNFGGRTVTTVAANTTVRLDGASSQMVGLEGTLATVGGTLIVNDGKSMAVSANGMTVGSGGLLTGNHGTLTGPVTIGLGGELAPGNSPGIFSFTNGLNMQGDYLIEIDDDGVGVPVAGVDYDQIRLTGGTLNVASSSLLQVSFVGSQTSYWGSNREWEIVDTTGSALLGDVWNFEQIIISGISAGNNWGIRRSDDLGDTGVYLTFSVIPEPSSMLLVVAMFAISLLRRPRPNANLN